MWPLTTYLSPVAPVYYPEFIVAIRFDKKKERRNGKYVAMYMCLKQNSTLLQKSIVLYGSLS